MCISINSIANEQTEEPSTPDYWACMPIFVEIDYSYLRKGEWVGEKKPREVILNQTINQVDSYIESKSWGLVNCENRAR